MKEWRTLNVFYNKFYCTVKVSDILEKKGFVYGYIGEGKNVIKAVDYIQIKLGEYYLLNKNASLSFNIDIWK